MNRRLARIFLADTTGMQVVLGIVSVLFAFGWCLADSQGGAYGLMLAQAPAWLWGAGFFIYGLMKFFHASHRTPKLTVYATALLGVYLWLFTFLSFADNPVRRMGSADVMILFMVIGEIWCGAGTLTKGEDDRRA